MMGMKGSRFCTSILRLFSGLILLFLVPDMAFAQLKVDAQIPINEAINRLVGQGVRVSNIRINCPSEGGRPYGYFTDNTGTLNIADGLIMTTGAASDAIGPNNSGAKTQKNKNKTQDPDLETIVSNGEKQFDNCVIEFDVEVFADTLTFDYVFGSEEYLEFIKTYHDVFGFFISGPGIPGRVNLALVPGTSDALSVENVNNASNSQFYIDNGTGGTPFDNLFVQYDGFTKKLESKIAVIPCQVYSLKLAICDVKDDLYDAGIFIAGKSLKTKAPKLSLRYEYPKFQTAIEGCNGAFVKVTRQSRLTEPIGFSLSYSGTAQRFIDFGIVPDSVYFLPNESEKEFFISFPTDGLADDNEQLLIDLINPCPGLPQVDQLSIPVRETFSFNLPDTRICLGDSVGLNPNPPPGFQYFWAPSSYLSCDSCINPKASPPFTFSYWVKAQDELSGCFAVDSLAIKVDERPIAAFSFTTREAYTSLDVAFLNQSINADRYSWTFGDGGTSTETNPFHYFQKAITEDSSTYTIVLTADNQALGCADTASARVSFRSPFFIPNLLTVNGDGANDAFFVKGIEAGVWSLEVYNRWGKRVYETGHYNLDWKGEGTTGTYFFKLSNPAGDRVFTGWVEVIGK